MNLKEKFFDLFNLYIEKKTQKNDILRVLKKLLPFKIEHNLMRLGENNDGGYLVPNDFNGIKENYSAGVGELTKFEKDLMELFSIKSNMIDFNHINLKILPRDCKFIKKKLGIVSSANEININEWLKNKSEEIIFKMDIEGDEYITLTSISDENLKKIRILVIELHDLRHLRNYFFFKTFEKIITRLNKFFYCCHLHVNNSGEVKNIGGIKVPDMLEITLIRKDRIKRFSGKYAEIPHKLDQKTVLSKDEIYIDKKWYS